MSFLPIRNGNRSTLVLQAKNRLEGQTRYGEARKPTLEGLVARGREPRSRDRDNLRDEIRWMPVSARIQPGRTTRQPQKSAAQKQRSRRAWCCSNPDPGD